ncbi:MAG: sigma-54 dependent transcriptional regulator [Bradymonadales bacterium]
MTTANILVVDDEKNIRRSLSMVLQDEDHEVETAESAEEGLRILSEHSFDILILDVQMGGMSGLEMLEHVKAAENAPEVIMMSGHATLSDAVNATRLGAFDFVEKPIDRERLLLTVRNCMEKRYLMLKVARLESDEGKHLGMIGESAAMQKVRTAVERVAPTKGKVLILGESGVGKDLVARAIHSLSDRAKKTFIKVNCSAIPSELIESELFGHEKGSFTGAVNRKRGLFEMADGGSIFLDEIGDMSLPAQAKVLRVLQNGEFTRVGSEKLSRVDVRVIAATNKNLKEAVDAGTFRDDLYFRLNVVPIEVPPLRERLEDVPLLANAFLAQLSQEYGRETLEVDDKAMAALCKYDYPGNIRELRNLCERLVIMASNPVTLLDLPEDLQIEEELSDVSDVDAVDIQTMIEPGSKSLRDFRLISEKAYIEATLLQNGWNVSKTADILGMERTNLHKKIKRFGLERTGMEE